MACAGGRIFGKEQTVVKNLCVVLCGVFTYYATDIKIDAFICSVWTAGFV
jgi:hypothetical protein